MKTKTQTILTISKILALLGGVWVFNPVGEPVDDTCSQFYKPRLGKTYV